MSKKILFVGAGAIGSYIGSFLTRAGHDVTLIDPWTEQVETVRAKGIGVTGPHDPFTARPKIYHLHEAQRVPRDFEVAFVAMKVYDTEWATQLALRHLAADGVVVSSQNCWPDPRVAAVAGAERSLGLIMSKIGVALWTPGQVERGMEKGTGRGHDVFRVGEHDGRVTKRAQELAEMLAVVDGSQVTENLWGERWSKLCQNGMKNGVSAATGLTGADCDRNDTIRRFSIKLGGEAVRVGQALGYHIEKIGKFEPEMLAKASEGDKAALDEVEAILRPGSNINPNPRADIQRPSMAQDIRKGRRTEIEFMNGYIAERGNYIGVPAPTHTKLTEIVKKVERKEVAAAPSLLGG